jgi:hypothetical protein
MQRWPPLGQTPASTLVVTIRGGAASTAEIHAYTKAQTTLAAIALTSLLVATALPTASSP